MCVTEHLALKTAEKWFYHAFPSAVNGGQVSASHPAGVKISGTCCLGCWVDSKTGPDALESRNKYLAPARNRTPVVQTVTRRYTDRAIPAHMQKLVGISNHRMC
jgi:hypothetical protein